MRSMLGTKKDEKRFPPSKITNIDGSKGGFREKEFTIARIILV